MNKKFDESKHPRGENGKFTNGGTKEFRQNMSYDELTKSKEHGKINLSRQEWAQFYAKLGEIERGGYVNATGNDYKMIPLGNKLVICSDTYEEPRVENVFEFSNEEKLFDYLKRKRGK